MVSWSIYKHKHSLYTLESKVYYLQVGYVIKNKLEAFGNSNQVTNLRIHACIEYYTWDVLRGFLSQVELICSYLLSVT